MKEEPVDILDEEGNCISQAETADVNWISLDQIARDLKDASKKSAYIQPSPPAAT